MKCLLPAKDEVVLHLTSQKAVGIYHLTSLNNNSTNYKQLTAKAVLMQSPHVHDDGPPLTQWVHVAPCYFTPSSTQTSSTRIELGSYNMELTPTLN